MRFDQYSNKYKNTGLSENILRQQYQLFRQEQEHYQRMMEEIAFRVAAQQQQPQLLLSGGGAPGGGGTSAFPNFIGLSLSSMMDDPTLVENTLYGINSDGSLTFFKTIGNPDDSNNIVIAYNSTDEQLYFISNTNSESATFNSLNLREGTVTTIAEISPAYNIEQMSYDPQSNTFFFLDISVYPPTNVYNIDTSGNITFVVSCQFEGNSGTRSLIEYQGTYYATSDFFIYDFDMTTGAGGNVTYGALDVLNVPGVSSYKVMWINSMTTINDNVYANVLIQDFDNSTYFYIIVSIDMANFVISSPGSSINATYIGPGDNIYGLSILS